MLSSFLFEKVRGIGSEGKNEVRYLKDRRLVLIEAYDHFYSLDVVPIGDFEKEARIVVLGDLVKEDENYYYVLTEWNEIGEDRYREKGTYWAILKKAVIRKVELNKLFTDS